MDIPLEGQVLCEQLPRSRTIRGFIEKRIRRWIAIHYPEQELKNSRPSYFVRLKKEGLGHWVDCQIEVKLGHETWIGFESGSGLHQATLRCLEHMTRVPRLPGYLIHFATTA